jgi:hypothetical protein
MGLLVRIRDLQQRVATLEGELAESQAQCALLATAAANPQSPFVSVRAIPPTAAAASDGTSVATADDDDDNDDDDQDALPPSPAAAAMAAARARTTVRPPTGAMAAQSLVGPRTPPRPSTDPGGRGMHRLGPRLWVGRSATLLGDLSPPPKALDTSWLVNTSFDGTEPTASPILPLDASRARPGDMSLSWMATEQAARAWAAAAVPISTNTSASHTAAAASDAAAAPSLQPRKRARPAAEVETDDDASPPLSTVVLPTPTAAPAAAASADVAADDADWAQLLAATALERPTDAPEHAKDGMAVAGHGDAQDECVPQSEALEASDDEAPVPAEVSTLETEATVAVADDSVPIEEVPPSETAAAASDAPATSHNVQAVAPAADMAPERHAVPLVEVRADDALTAVVDPWPATDAAQVPVSSAPESAVPAPPPLPDVPSQQERDDVQATEPTTEVVVGAEPEEDAFLDVSEDATDAAFPHEVSDVATATAAPPAPGAVTAPTPTPLSAPAPTTEGVHDKEEEEEEIWLDWSEESDAGRDETELDADDDGGADQPTPAAALSLAPTASDGPSPPTPLASLDGPLLDDADIATLRARFAAPSLPPSVSPPRPERATAADTSINEVLPPTAQSTPARAPLPSDTSTSEILPPTAQSTPARELPPLAADLSTVTARSTPPRTVVDAVVAQPPTPMPSFSDLHTPRTSPLREDEDPARGLRTPPPPPPPPSLVDPAITATPSPTPTAALRPVQAATFSPPTVTPRTPRLLEAARQAHSPLGVVDALPLPGSGRRDTSPPALVVPPGGSPVVQGSVAEQLHSSRTLPGLIRSNTALIGLRSLRPLGVAHAAGPAPVSLEDVWRWHGRPASSGAAPLTTTATAAAADAASAAATAAATAAVLVRSPPRSTAGASAVEDRRLSDVLYGMLGVEVEPEGEEPEPAEAALSLVDVTGVDASVEGDDTWMADWRRRPEIDEASWAGSAQDGAEWLNVSNAAAHDDDEVVEDDDGETVREADGTTPRDPAGLSPADGARPPPPPLPPAGGSVARKLYF